MFLNWEILKHLQPVRLGRRRTNPFAVMSLLNIIICYKGLHLRESMTQDCRSSASEGEKMKFTWLWENNLCQRISHEALLCCFQKHFKTTSRHVLIRVWIYDQVIVDHLSTLDREFQRFCFQQVTWLLCHDCRPVDLSYAISSIVSGEHVLSGTH